MIKKSKEKPTHLSTGDIFFKIAAIEKEIRVTPYHKGTEHYIGRLKAQLAKLKAAEEQSSKKFGKKYGFFPKKTGDATVVIIGPPSVGKSTLINQLTGTHSRVEPWPFTTVTVIPGIMKYKGAFIQILDLPGIIDRASVGFGGGREVLSVARIADLILLMVDIKNRGKIKSLTLEIQKMGILSPCLTIINKVDLLEETPHNSTGKEIFISAQSGYGIGVLKEKIWDKLNLIRTYLKPKGSNVDFAEPLILKKGQRVTDVAKKIFPEKNNFKQILIWGPSAMFPGQQISLDHPLEDEDILSFS